MQTAEDKLPRGAVITVIVGLIASGVAALLTITGSGSAHAIQWDHVDPIVTPAARSTGREGSVRLTRTTISSLDPNGAGYRIFQIAGVLRVDPGRWNGSMVAKCAVTGLGKDTTIARTPGKRGAWPRPSDNLRLQPVPEAVVIKFHARGSDVLGFPIRDYFNRYSNSNAAILVDWFPYRADRQGWTWSMPPRTGTAALAFAVLFRTPDRPAAKIDCSARSDGPAARILIPTATQASPNQAPAEEAAGG